MNSPPLEWYVEYKEELDFIENGDYDSVIINFLVNDSHSKFKSCYTAFLKRLKDEDLPLFVSFDWHYKDILRKYLSRLRK